MRLHRLRLRRATARLGASTALLAALIAAAALTAWASPPPAAGPGKPDLPLTGEWQFRQVGQEAWHKAEVPGTVHQDLMASGLIPDPFYRDNELKVQWVENADWEYRRMFDLPADIAARKHLELVCGGLDTFASLYLNGREIGRTDNMFRTWRFDAKPFLEPGANEIRVVFASPVRREKEMADKLPYSIPGNAPHARKAPYSFGWDWGPRLATSGIWRSIGLESWDEARLTDLDIQQDLSRKDEVTLKVAVVVESDREGRAELKVSVEPGSTVSLPLTLTSGLSRQRAEIKVGNPRLWWPNGLGEQNLYRVRAELHRGSSLLDSASRRIGLRTLELVQDKDAWGTSFYFRVNGVPFFAKGGNWIPADSFLPRVTRARYESLLRDCRAANMNMLRVWGGGAYESEDFYDLCDELGLVVWQDFMFACQMVPGDAAFRENVRVEAEQVVKALRHHPSLGLWCGNNECEEGWFFWGWKQTLPAKLWEDYQAIFEGILPRAVQAYDPGRPYWPSSPHTLNKTGDPRSEESGDMHYWGVWHGQEPFEEYQKHNHRFYSEFGFQSFPLLDTVETYTHPEDRNITSPVMEQHQKHPEGNRLIMLYMLDWFRFPKDFESLLWLSQVLQAEGMKMAVEHYRSRMPRIMGSLYWQVEDCWPVASWAGLDYLGHWKALQYYARRFYNPVLITAIRRGENLEVKAVSDERVPGEVDFNWSVRTYSGQILREETRRVVLPANAGTRLLDLPLADLRRDRQPEEVYFACELAQDGKPLSSNLYHFSRLKRVDLPDPGLILSPGSEAGAMVVEIRTRNLAKDVYLAAPGCPGRFGDNFFDMLPGRTCRVRFIPAEGATPELFRERLTVRSLRDTY